MRYQAFTFSLSSAAIPGYSSGPISEVFGEKEVPILPVRLKLTGQNLTNLIAHNLIIDQASSFITSKTREIGYSYSASHCGRSFLIRSRVPGPECSLTLATLEHLCPWFNAHLPARICVFWSSHSYRHHSEPAQVRHSVWNRVCSRLELSASSTARPTMQVQQEQRRTPSSRITLS